MSQDKLAKEVALLSEALDQAVADAHKRKTIMLAILLIAVVAMGIYLSFAYSKIAEVDAKLVVTLAEGEVMSKLSGSGDELVARVEENLPQVLDHLEARVKQAPDAMITELKARIESSVDQAIPELEAQLVAELEKNIAAAKEKMGDGEITEEQFKKAMDDIAAEYGKQLKKMVDDLYVIYQSNSEELVNYLDRLADNQGLNEREQQHRKLVTLFLALLERYAQEAQAGTLETM